VYNWPFDVPTTVVSTTVVTGAVKVEVTGLEALKFEKDEVVLGVGELLDVLDVGSTVGEVDEIGVKDEDESVDVPVKDDGGVAEVEGGVVDEPKIDEELFDADVDEAMIELERGKLLLEDIEDGADMMLWEETEIERTIQFSVFDALASLLR
jgi:hypothetical protein